MSAVHKATLETAATADEEASVAAPHNFDDEHSVAFDDVIYLEEDCAELISKDHSHYHDNDHVDESSLIVSSLLHRPIVVGYAFGPKKMSTMGVVMAEASKTRLSTKPGLLLRKAGPEAATLNALQGALLGHQPNFSASSEQDKSIHSHTDATQLLLGNKEGVDVDENKSEAGGGLADTNQLTIRASNLSLTQEVLSSFTKTQPKHVFSATGDASLLFQPQPRRPISSTSSRSSGGGSNSRKKGPPSSVLFSLDHQYIESGSVGGHRTGSNAVVRHLRSSSPSSTSSWASTGTRTASTAASFRTISGTAVTSNNSTSYQHTGTTDDSSAPGANSMKRRYPIRVSFVPLDPEIPLEEQHGGIDVILHKLTEDILVLSQRSTSCAALQSVLQSSERSDAAWKDLRGELSDSDIAAIRRVDRLCQFQKRVGCSLVDDPLRVQTLMSRADIAQVLHDCLSDVTSQSGLAVESPKYAVVKEMEAGRSRTDADQHDARLAQQKNLLNAAREAKLSFPVIVKPLIAAGTKASHAMAVVAHPAGLEQIACHRIPCMLQEYVNHDAVLYKVYVLGDFVSVFKRRSLPNLPAAASLSIDATSAASMVVEFDSQRPYPRLRDFGYPQHFDDEVATGTGTKTSDAISVTSEEVRPIVNALKAAFGLEMFGFDVLITSESHGGSAQRMLVVDVNYFPSYKEVLNFPALLAKYLTARAIASRLAKSKAAQ